MRSERGPLTAPRHHAGSGWATPAALAVACLLAAGCADRRYAEVTGSIQLGGKPLAGAFVVFTPNRPDEVRGVGSTDAAGRYRILRPGGKFGAPLGPCTVSVHGGDSGTPIPKQYSTASELVYDVKPGANEFNVDIPGR